MLYTGLPFLERLPAAKRVGVSTIEFWDWRDKNLDSLSWYLDKYFLRVSNISGNRLYSMVDPQEETLLINEISESIRVAVHINCPRVMLLVQSLMANGRAKPAPGDLSYKQKIEQIITCGRAAGKVAEKFNAEIVIEPLNSVLDHPDYFLDSASMAFMIIKEINHPRVKLLYDIYHMAVMEENIISDLESNQDLIGYIHAADWPGRREPGSGKIGFKQIFSLLSSLDFSGIIGFECYPSDGNSQQAIHRILELTAPW